MLASLCAPLSLCTCVCCLHSESAWGTYDEVFAFERTVSRLVEMQSEEYLERAWRPDVEVTRGEYDDLLEGAAPAGTPTVTEVHHGEVDTDAAQDGVEFARSILEVHSSVCNAQRPRASPHQCVFQPGAEPK